MRISELVRRSGVPASTALVRSPRSATRWPNAHRAVALPGWPVLWAIGLYDHSDEGIDEFLGGCVLFVGAEKATQFQVGGTVRAGQKHGPAAPGVLFADDCSDDGEVDSTDQRNT